MMPEMEPVPPCLITKENGVKCYKVITERPIEQHKRTAMGIVPAGQVAKKPPRMPGHKSPHFKSGVTIERILELLAQGWSQWRIGKELGCDGSLISVRLREYYRERPEERERVEEMRRRGRPKK